MKKSTLIIVVMLFVTALLLSACNQHVCPAYANGQKTEQAHNNNNS